MKPMHIDDRAERATSTLPTEEAPTIIVSLKRPGFVPIKLDDLDLTAEDTDALATGAETLFSEASLKAGHQRGLETDPAFPRPATD